MKINRYLLACLLLISGFAKGQDSNLKQANKLFAMRAYKEASQLYETKLRNQEVLQNLGDCYLYNSDFEKACYAYRELFLEFENSVDKQYRLKYGQALKGLMAYETADTQLEIYYGRPFNTAAFIVKNWALTRHKYALKPIQNKNSTGDFGLSYFKDNKVAFASTRNSDNPTYRWNDLPYLDLYTATLTDQNTLEGIEPITGNINTDNHESNAVISKDGKTMYFNRTNNFRVNIDGEKVANIKIYKAEYKNDKWTNISALSFTSNKYSTEHPTLSKDGKTMYFASDMPGTLGGFDIFKVAINEDGTFGIPENLGNLINTPQREQFPFISDHDVLYFSSLGHEGYGGLDIFRSNLANGVFDEPINLGESINSSLDDFAFVVEEENNKGFLSSNRSGKDKIYSFERTLNASSKYQVEGIVKDKNSNEILAGSTVALMDEEGQLINEIQVGDDAYYIFEIEADKKYKIRGTRKAYIPQDVEFSTDSNGRVQHNIYLSLESYDDAEEIVSENEKGLVQVKLEQIFFDYAKSYIREDAAKTLDKLVAVMKKYPSMEIEVSAHTDARGSYLTNLYLSRDRAASTLEYLVSQGIERSRLKSRGYGEMYPLNHCTEENMCTKEEYEINRRCEFTIMN